MELPPPPPGGSPPFGRLPPPGADAAGATLAAAAFGPPPGSFGGAAPEPDAGGGALVGRLDGAWRWTLGLGWCVVLAGLGAVAQAAYLVDADPWWLSFKPLPFALPVAAMLALVSDARWALPFSIAGALVIGALAVVDALGGNPVVALGEAVCAASALVLTGAALLGRARRPSRTVPGSAA